MPLPAGSENGRRNKKTITSFMKNLEPDNENPVYDSIHSFYGIIDDDNDRLRGDHPDYIDITNLFVLNRYAKENYVLDPINIYFHLKSLTDKESGKNNNIKMLLNKINNKKGLKLFTLKEIYQEIQKLTKSEETVKAITEFLHTIVGEFKDFIFDILFKAEEDFFKFKLTTPIILQWFLNIKSELIIRFKTKYKENKKIIKSKHIFINRIENIKYFIEKFRENFLLELEDSILINKMNELEKLNTDSNLYDFLKQFCIDGKTTVSVLGIELEYSKFFTCIQGHFLEQLLNHGDIFGGNVACDKIIKNFNQTGTEMFIPDEIINIYRTICHNIIYLDDNNFDTFVKQKHSNKNWFIFFNANDCEKFNR